MVLTISGNQDFETQQQRSANAYSILIIMPILPTSMYIEKSRPYDAGYDNEHTESLDTGTNKTDPVAYGGFEGG
jgi:hypothetical protein